MTEQEPAMEHNWLQAYLIESIDKRLCTSIYCTTCGAQEFRHGLFDAVARATDQPRTPQLEEKSARAIAEALTRVQPVQSRTGPDHEVSRYEKAVRLVIYDLWLVFTPLAPVPLESILGNTWAGNMLTRMQTHHRSVMESRDRKNKYESPERVAERREEKRRQRRGPHEQRLALKKERDRLWRLTQPETPEPRNSS